MTKTLEDLARESSLTQQELREFACICAERAITQSCLDTDTLEQVDIPERTSLLRCAAAIRKSWDDNTKLRRIERAVNAIRSRLWDRLGIIDGTKSYDRIAYRFGYAIDSTELAAYTSHNSTDTVKPSRDDAIIAVRAAEGWMRYSLYWKYFPYGYDGMRQESERDTNGKKMGYRRMVQIY